MLVDFVFHRDVSSPQAAERAQTIGERAIRVAS
jgi:hypothetical protein